jgi:hypothetical protein
MLILHFKCLSVANSKKSLIPIIKITTLTFMSQKSTEVATKNVAYCVQKIFCEHSYLQYSSATRTANRTHVRNRAVSGLVIQISII